MNGVVPANVQERVTEKRMTANIPLWVDGKQKYISGVTKSTTCNDIVYSVLKNTGGRPENVINYSIYEGWQEVERPLDGRIKILKVWQVWGSEQKNVKLTLKKGRESPLSYNKKTAVKSNIQHSKYSHKKDKKEKIKRYQINLDKIIKIVFSQDCKIKEQLEQIQRTEAEIDIYESKIHFHRLRTNGLNYLQDSYLLPFCQTKEENKDFNVKDFERCIELYQEIIKMNEELTLKENKINEMTFLLQHEVSYSILNKEDSLLLTDVLQAKEKLKTCEDLYCQQKLELENLESSLNDNECMLEEKNIYFNALVYQLDSLEKEHPFISDSNHTHKNNNSTFSSIKEHILLSKKSNEGSDSDSNSDTGLSSLHSSNEDDLYTVETLV